MADLSIMEKILLRDVTPSLKHSYIYGLSKFEFAKNKETPLYLICKTEEGSLCKAEDLNIKVKHGRGYLALPIRIRNYAKTGMWEIILCYRLEGTHQIEIRINNQTLSFYNIPVQKAFQFNVLQNITEIGTREDFARPWGVCVHANGDIYISDIMNDVVNVLDCNFKHLKVIGESGTGLGMFRAPSGLAIDHDGNLLVCDQNNNRIQVLTSGGDILRNTSDQLDLKLPLNVAVTETNTYVVTYDNSRICVLSNFLIKLKEIEYTFDYITRSPVGLCTGLLNDILFTDYVTGAVGTIDPVTGQASLKFRTFPYYNGIHTAKHNQGIYVDSNGYILITDSKNNVLEVYTYHGNLVKRIFLPGKCINVVQIRYKLKTYVVTMEDARFESSRVCCVEA